VKVDSESLWSYEIGAKTKLFDDRLRLNVAGYRIDWEQPGLPYRGRRNRRQDREHSRQSG
jgi:outer membrane receptor for ferric coprogen and ferric-rhodotorulic acid